MVLFRLAEHNVRVGNQPHSEGAGLSVVLESWLGPVDDSSRFTGGQIEVVPSEQRKRVLNREED